MPWLLGGLNVKLKNDNLKDGDIVWICDFRHEDIFKKPLRNVQPTKVIVLSNEKLPCNKTVYYSETHFRTLNKKGEPSSKIIAPFDNTGFRGRTGGCVNIFDDEKECIECFNNQCLEIKKQIEEGKQYSINRFDKMLNYIEEKFIK